MRFDNANEVVEVFLLGVFYAHVVYDEGKLDVTGLVLE
jgi:hypothetical protein